MTPSLDVSVVLCTRDRPELAAAAVASIVAGEAHPVEILVVDQSPEPAAVFEGLGAGTPVAVRHVRAPARGVSFARNLGASEARGGVVAFVDDDILAEPGWLGSLHAALEGRLETRTVTGRVLAGEPEVEDGFVPAVSVPDFSHAVYRGRLPIDVLAGGNMAIARAVFSRVGGFDVRLGPGTPFPSSEDNDLGLRLLDSGLEIVHVPDAVVVHRAWRPGREYPLVRWRYGLGKGGFYAKHAWNGGPYGLRRAARDMGKRLVRAPRVVWRTPRYAAGELTYGAGIALGMVRWVVRGRTR